MDKLLSLLKTNARLSNQELAAMLGTTADEVDDRIKELERKGIIKGYTAIVDEELTQNDSIAAYIELSVTPKAQVGYDDIARLIASYPEVESISLMSGGYDLAVTLRCRNIKDASLFVAQRLATIDGVISTSTHFFLQKYKENGIMLVDPMPDERGQE
ncbi:MAG TPA: Lrp/AsnC family transcriptional regulator [Candidatus Faeciplasma pullistercoris]|uniref:Lrp/AsnC family transcriptional regulator n=1 Tax=Candidatus Faeciplasma pullistercoris TaxID=2840800 RepID=A0A9D1GU56_9FIRM|nr:Lrp/AsnC family transcriptional regulator [Candidatus Faeciplasma pullistercoris]